MQGPESRTISAVIPYDIYTKMEELARKYPQFVVPLPREVVDEQGEKREGAEMHFMVSFVLHVFRHMASPICMLLT